MQSHTSPVNHILTQLSTQIPQDDTPKAFLFDHNTAKTPPQVVVFPSLQLSFFNEEEKEGGEGGGARSRKCVLLVKETDSRRCMSCFLNEMELLDGSGKNFPLKDHPQNLFLTLKRREKEEEI